MNRRMSVLQTDALPLGYAAQKKMERETGFEPATSTLARLHSTTELFPLIVDKSLFKLLYLPLSTKNSHAGMDIYAGV